MKTSSKNLTVILLAFSAFLTSCGVGDLNKKAEETSNNFFTAVQKKDYIAALGLCSSKAFVATTRESWTKALEKNEILLGSVKSFTKTNSGFNIATSTNSGTTVVETYDVQRQYGVSHDSVQMIKEADGTMKVFKYEWKVMQARFLTALDSGEKQAGEYMQAIKTGNYDAAISMCSQAALTATPKDKWAGFLNNAKSKLGDINNYSIVKDSSSFHIDAKGESGEGNYYDIFVQSDRTGGNKVMEKIVLFQKNYDEPLQIAGHFFL